jgi:hypothetical protein
VACLWPWTQSLKALGLVVHPVSTRCFTAFILVSTVCFCITAILCPITCFRRCFLLLPHVCQLKAQEYCRVLKSDFTNILFSYNWNFLIPKPFCLIFFM